MGRQPNASTVHHVLEHLALRNRSVVGIKHFWNALKRTAIGCFHRHGVEEEPQGGFNIFAVDTVVLLIAHATAVIDHAVKHQQRIASTRFYPRGLLEMFEIRRAQIKVPTLIAELSLKAHRRRLSRQALLVIAPCLQVVIDRTTGEQTFRRLDEALRRVDAMLLQ